MANKNLPQRTSSGSRALRPRTRRQLPESSDRRMVLDGEGLGTTFPFVSSEGYEFPPDAAALGVAREEDYRANPVNPLDEPAPAAKLRGSS